jgi:Tol biopolymer transport system component
MLKVTNHPANDSSPDWSPDGSRIAFVSDRDSDIVIENQPPMPFQSEIYVMRADGSGQTRLTAAPTQKLNPTWSPDGTRLLYRVLTVVLEQPGTLFLMNADGSVQTELVEGGLGGWQPAP